MASDLNIAFGAQYRKEEFDLYAGDQASWELGVLADQGFSSRSNGFGGFPNSTSADQDSTAFYVDLEADNSKQAQEDPRELAKAGMVEAVRGFVRHVSEHPDMGLCLKVTYDP